MYRSYTTNVKLIWDLPRLTHTWLVTHLLGCGLPTAKETILAGFTCFLARQRKSASWEVSVMVDLEVMVTTSVTGRNVTMFKRELGTNSSSLTPRQNRVLVRAAEKLVLLKEKWKLDML